MPLAFASQLPQLHALCSRVGVSKLGLFGSATSERFEPTRSDLDFLVEFRDMPPAIYADAYFKLKEGLEALFARPVDLLTPSALRNPYLRKQVEGELQPVYAG